MSTPQNNPSPPQLGRGRLWIGGVLRLLMAGVFVAGQLFWGAGTWDWFRGQLFLAVFVGSILFNMILLLWKVPGLMRERWKRRTDTKRFDKVFGLFYAVSTLAMITFSGVDSVRYRWTEMSESFIYVGLALHILGTIPVLWALLTNPHTETTVRIQKDRGHRVISDGPYRYVRHPMYIGIILMFFGWAFLLGSWVSVALAGWIAVLFVARTALEDKTLQNELGGYRAFCRQTRYRLVPGIW